MQNPTGNFTLENIIWNIALDYWRKSGIDINVFVSGTNEKKTYCVTVNTETGYKLFVACDPNEVKLKAFLYINRAVNGTVDVGQVN